MLVHVVGRPTGYVGEGNEQAWKRAVREALTPHEFPAPVRLGVEIEFRLDESQRGRNAPDLDDLVKSTIDAFDGLLARRPVAGRPQADDERIDRIAASKRLVQPGEPAGATIVVWPLPSGEPVQ